MALATINQRVWVATNRNDTEYLNFLETIITQDLGFQVHDSDAGTTDWITNGPSMSRVYSFQYNNSTFGTVYLRVGTGGFNSPSVHLAIYSSWNSSTNSGTLRSSVHLLEQVSYTDNNTYLFTIYNHPEVKMISVGNNTDRRNFGILRPANKPNFWSDDVALYSFLYSNTPLLNGNTSVNELEFSSVGNPYIGAVQCNVFPSNGNTGDIFAQKPNPYTGRYPVISAPYIFSDESSTATRGFVGQFSNDIIIGNSPGLNTIVQINGATTRYRFCTNHVATSNGHPALGVKIVD